jgi:hypothetical protein
MCGSGGGGVTTFVVVTTTVGASEWEVVCVVGADPVGDTDEAAAEVGAAELTDGDADDEGADDEGDPPPLPETVDEQPASAIATTPSAKQRRAARE